ncbi:MAG: GGDEF domain-containing protein [Burkholderiaceae bacterium]|nr:GGDEF domain-containing protein [Roseateles sp.]MBV8470062.1 GGDEF domain-containing protein [Burkholderiaceae bacterium]
MKVPYLRRALAMAVLALGTIAGPTPAAHAAEPEAKRDFDESGLAARIDDLGLSSIVVPEESLRSMELLRVELAGDATRDHRDVRLHPIYQSLLVQMALAHLTSGDIDSAQQLASQLESAGHPTPRSELVQAMIALRKGLNPQAYAGAKRVLAQLAPPCEDGQEADSVAKGCDALSAWAALDMLEREQLGLGANANAVVLSQRMVRLAEATHSTLRRAVSLAILARSEGVGDQREQAQIHIGQALELSLSHPVVNGYIKFFESRVLRLQGDTSERIRILDDCLATAESAHAAYLAAMARVNLSDAYLISEKPQKALELARLAIPVLQHYKDQQAEHVAHLNSGHALIALGRFEEARHEIALTASTGENNLDTTRRIRELRELDEAWTGVSQPLEALKLFHQERMLQQEANDRARDASLQTLSRTYDSARKQRDLELLQRQHELKEQQLDNARLGQKLGMSVAALAALSLLAIVLLMRRLRLSNRQLRRNQALLKAQSERDPLTDLANRRHFLAVMEQQEQQLFHGALLMIDIDHFKQINDVHGHGAGDVVIKEVAHRIQVAVREQDLVVRWGGEEFLVFVRKLPDEHLRLLAERVLQGVRGSAIQTESGALQVSVSIGFVQFPLMPDNLSVPWERAVNWADMLLYSAKAQGRNAAIGVAAVHPAPDTSLQQIEQDFEAACTQGQISLVHLPGPDMPS